ncbi:Hpt domain-containing protein [Nitrosophilus alvini]|uniref:Hpt domain-containing protein n=1 Tax=Nitrosophilus alvini TaxID=2714855 RepID=UPI001909C439|nr:Hpt domain-containing protein [Nitrosophilus alvini]
MILYTKNRELVGISDYSLQLLGYSSLDELKEDIKDIAELFEVRPGYVYNFENFSWLNFVLHSNIQTPRAIIHTKNNHEFECKITVDMLYMDNGETFYSVRLENIKGVSNESSLSQNHDTPQPDLILPTEYQDQEEDNFRLPDQNIEENPEISAFQTDMQPQTDEVLISQDNTDTPEIFKTEQAETFENEKLDINLDFDTPSSIEEEAPLFFEEKEEPATTKISESPIFDPEDAAKELGLTPELITEFVKEFINQAIEYKPKFEELLSSENIEEIRNYSHKLKGAAANLRIEKAVEILSVINSSNDKKTLEEKLSEFYDFIKELKEQLHIEEDVDTTISLPVENDTVFEKDISDHTNQNEEEIYPFDIIKETEPKEQTEYDTEKIANEIGLPKTLIHELIKDFIKEAKKQKETIYSLISDQKKEELQKTAKKLKGITDNLRLEEFSAQLSKLCDNNESENKADAADKFFEMLENLSKTIEI